LSVSEDRTVHTAPAPTAPGTGIADPGPLGLAAFAATTFLLSAKNAGWMTHATGSAWLGFAFAYGGLAQLCAAMWEYRNKNVVGATAFGTFAAFWIGLALWVEFVVNPAVAAGVKAPATLPTVVTTLNHDLGWILLAFGIFTLYITVLTAQVNLTTFVIFFLLLVTLIVLMIGNFTAGSHLLPTGTIKFGGYVGLATALAAWYGSFAGMAKFMGGRLRIPLGPPLLRP
jgi:uncharacterized protein